MPHSFPSRRALAAIALATVLVAACATRAPRIALDEAALRRAARIEIVYVEGAAPTVAYLPAPGVANAPALAPGLAGETGDDASACLPLATGQETAATSPARRAAWAWDVRAARSAPQDFARRVVAERIDTLFLQVDGQLESDGPLIEALVAAGLRVIALDGYPDALAHPQALERDIERILRFNASHVTKIKGFQVDVEPYLLLGFRLDAQAGFARYLELLSQLRSQLGQGLEFSAAIPFWYASERVAGRNLADAVLATTDTVAVMSYRTTRAQVVELSRPVLCLAARHGRGAWVGLEFAPLKSEVHLVLDAARLGGRVRREAGGLVLVAGDGLPVLGSYTVKAGDLSFNGNPQRLRELVASPLPDAGFAGWAINGLSFAGNDALLR